MSAWAKCTPLFDVLEVTYGFKLNDPSMMRYAVVLDTSFKPFVHLIAVVESSINTQFVHATLNRVITNQSGSNFKGRSRKRGGDQQEL